MDFDHYISKWRLTPDGAPVITRSSRLLPVRRQGEPAMLKIAVEREEQYGGLLMVWWNGEGAARVLEHDDVALLLERAEGHGSLATMAGNGADDEATRILCKVAANLHAPRPRPLPELIPLEVWFRDLFTYADKLGGILPRCADTARYLLAAPREVSPLHGDIHHGNVLDFGERGWLAIDPKRLLGERGFDYANIFCNPGMDMVQSPGRFLRQVEVVCDAAGLDRERLLQWALSWAGLSAVWSLTDGDPPDIAFTVAAMAAAALEEA